MVYNNQNTAVMITKLPPAKVPATNQQKRTMVPAALNPVMPGMWKAARSNAKLNPVVFVLSILKLGNLETIVIGERIKRNLKRKIISYLLTIMMIAGARCWDLADVRLMGEFSRE